MARMIFCPDGHPNAEDAVYCARTGCKMQIDPSSTGPGPAAQEAPPPPSARHARADPPQNDEAARARTPRPAAETADLPSLAFEWGEMQIDGRLPVGRDPGFSPLAENLERFLTVSRKHAVLAVGFRGSVDVEDMGSTHGTKVNGRLIKSGVRHPVLDGDKISFADDVVAELRLGRQR